MSIPEAFKSGCNVVYGGAEPDGYKAARTYRALRQRGLPAARALQDARSHEKGLWPIGGNIGAPFGDGLRWVERPRDAGLRFAGYADELAGRAIDHKGWYTDDYQEQDVLRGAVYRLPHGRYVAGYQRCDWKGRADSDAAVVAFGEIFTAEPGGDYADSDHYGAHREAAFRADAIAESAAESERDWNRAWQDGSEFARIGEEVADYRREALELLKERHGVELPPAMCATIKARVESLLESIREARKKRAELADRYDGLRIYVGRDNALTVAFREGAGI